MSTAEARPENYLPQQPPWPEKCANESQVRREAKEAKRNPPQLFLRCFMSSNVVSGVVLVVLFCFCLFCTLVFILVVALLLCSCLFPSCHVCVSCAFFSRLLVLLGSWSWCLGDHRLRARIVISHQVGVKENVNATGSSHGGWQKARRYLGRLQSYLVMRMGTAYRESCLTHERGGTRQCASVGVMFPHRTGSHASANGHVVGVGVDAKFGSLELALEHYGLFDGLLDGSLEGAFELADERREEIGEIGGAGRKRPVDYGL